MGAARMTLHAVSKPEQQQLVWEAFPSWAQVTWLYLLSAVSALRGALLFRFDVGGWEMWIIGAGMLLVCGARYFGIGRTTISRGIILRCGITRQGARLKRSR